MAEGAKLELPEEIRACLFDLDESSRVSLSFYGKKPGMGMVPDKASMQFSLDETEYRADTLEAYERLLRDAMTGDHTLFTTAKDIERLWEVSTPLLENPPPVKPYPPGSWGPAEIGALIGRLATVRGYLDRPDLLTTWLAAGHAVRTSWPREPGAPVTIAAEPAALLDLGRRGGWVTSVDLEAGTVTAMR